MSLRAAANLRQWLGRYNESQTCLIAMLLSFGERPSIWWHMSTWTIPPGWGLV